MDWLSLPSFVRLFSNDIASGGNELLIGIRNPRMAVSSQQHLAGRDFRFDPGKVIRKTDALGAALPRLAVSPANHERHLPVVDDGSKRTRVKLASTLPLSSITVDP
jgi:hypothetical protein